MRRIALAPALAAVAVLAGCTETLDNEDLESKLRTQLAPQGGAKPEDISVDCPDDQEVKKGRKFKCTLIAPDDTKLPVNVTLTNDEGGFEAIVARPPRTMDTADLEAKLRTQLAPQGGVKPKDISVACPEGQEIKTGHEFSCTLTAPDGSKARIDVTLTNDRGGFDAIVPEDQFDEQ
jgi:translation initiation factor 1 (eIF-1/SUI1)